MVRRLVLMLGVAAALPQLAAEAAAQGRVDSVTVMSAALASNRLGDPFARTALVYLPPGYDATPDARYPVLYLLHAWGVPPAGWLGGPGSYEGLNLATALDELIARGTVQPMLVVMPDAHTRLGGSWYARSGAAGDWEAFVASDLVRFIDGRYRTRPEAAMRGLAGQSMGAYGALRIAMLRPGVFGPVLAMSPVLVSDPNALGEAAARAALENTGDATALPASARVTWSKAAAFSPDGRSTTYAARLPWRAGTDGLDTDSATLALWHAATLMELVRSHGGILRDAPLRLEIGTRDPMLAETRALSARLDALGVAHALEVFNGDHTAGVRGRFQGPVFAFFDTAFRGGR